MRNNFTGVSAAQSYKNKLNQLYTDQVNAAIQQMEAQKSAGQTAMSNTYSTVSPTVSDNLTGFPGAISTFTTNYQKALQEQQEAEATAQKAWAKDAMTQIRAARKSGTGSSKKSTGKSTASAKAETGNTAAAAKAETAASAGSSSGTSLADKYKAKKTASGTSGSKAAANAGTSESAGIVGNVWNAFNTWAKGDNGTEESLHADSARLRQNLNTAYSAAGKAANEKVAAKKQSKAEAAQKWQETQKQAVAALPAQDKALLDEWVAVRKSRNYDQLSQRPAQIRRELLNKGYDADALNEMVVYLDEQKNAELAARNAQQQAAGVRAGSGNAVTQSLLSVPQNLLGGVLSTADYATQYAAKALTGSDAPIDQNAPGQFLRQTANTTRSTVSEDLTNNPVQLWDENTSNKLVNYFGKKLNSAATKAVNKTGSFLYQTGMSGLDSAAAMFAPAASGGTLLGVSAGAQSMSDALEQGASANQAALYGVAAGVFEGLFEKVSIGSFKKLQTQAVVRTAKDALKNIAKEAGVNFSEEFATQVADDAAEYFILGDRSQWQQTYQNYVTEYRNQGLSQEDAAAEASKKVAVDLTKDFMLAGLGGALMGSAFGAVGNLSGVRNSHAVDAYRQYLPTESRTDFNGQSARQVYEGMSDEDKYAALATGSLEQQDRDAELQDAAQAVVDARRQEQQRIAALQDPAQNPAVQNVLANLHTGADGTSGNTAQYAIPFLTGENVRADTAAQRQHNRIALAAALGVQESQIPNTNRELRSFIKGLTDADFAAYTQSQTAQPQEAQTAQAAAQPIAGTAQNAPQSVSAQSNETILPTPQTQPQANSAPIPAAQAAQAQTQTAQAQQARQPLTAAQRYTDTRTQQEKAAARAAQIDTAAESLQASSTGISSEAERYFRQGAQNADNLRTYTTGFRKAYQAGLSGKAESTLSTVYGTADAASRDSLRLAYLLGQSERADRQTTAQRQAQRQAEGKTIPHAQEVHEAVNIPDSVRNDPENQGLRFVDKPRTPAAQSVQELVEKLAKLNGNHAVYWVDDAPFNGKKDGSGNIYLNASLGTQEAIRTTFGHELTHFLEDAKSYQELSKFIRNSDSLDAWIADFTGDRCTSLQDYLAHKKELYADYGAALTDAEAMQEVVADWCGDNLINRSAYSDRAVRELCGEHRSLAEKLRDFLNNVLEALTGTSHQENVRHALDLFEQALAETYGEKTAARGTGGTRHSINRDFAGEIRDWDRKGRTEKKIFTLGTTGEALKSIGVKDKNIVMLSSKIRDILKEHSSMTVDLAAQIPDILENPVLVLESTGKSIRTEKEENSRIVVIGAVKDQNGNAVLCALDLMPTTGLDIKLRLQDFNKVSSAYAKENGQKAFLENSRVLYADGDKKKTGAVLSSFGFQLATTELNRSGSIGSVTYNNGKIKIQGEPFSNVFSDMTKKAEAYHQSDANNRPKTTAKTDGEFTSAVASVTQKSETVNKPVSHQSKTKFSLSKPVEQVGNLVAVHNTTADKLLKSLKLGGFPMPSIAVTRAEYGWPKFGQFSLVFRKAAIDPKASRKNTVYSADAWTPTVPATEYDVNPVASRRFSEHIEKLTAKVDSYFQDELRQIQSGLEDGLNRHNGEEGLVQWAMDSYALKAAFLEEQGTHVVPQTTRVEAKKGFMPERAGKYQAAAKVLGTTDPDTIGHLPLKEIKAQYGEALEQAFPGMTKSAMRMSSVLHQMQEYFRSRDTEPAYETVTDSAATRQFIDKALDQSAFETWVRELYAGTEGASGVYNNKDIFTPSGNRRSFAQLHYPATLEGIVKAMAGQGGGDSRNVSGFYGTKSLRAGAAAKFKSVAEMHAQEGRLQNLSESEQTNLQDSLNRRLDEILDELAESSPSGKRKFDYLQESATGEILMDIARSGRYTPDSIRKQFNGEYNYHIENNLAEKIGNLLVDISQMPVDMFEAKPERAVLFSEVAAVIAPSDADTALLQQLQSAGVQQILTYEAGSEDDRKAKLNSLSGVRFSLPDKSLSDRLNESLSEIMAMDSVSEIDVGDSRVRYTGDRKTDEKTAQEVFRAQGLKAYRKEFGQIDLSRKGINHSIFHGNNAAKQAAFTAVKAVIEKGRQIYSDLQHKGNRFNTYTLAAPVTFGGEKIGMAVIIKQVADRGRPGYYIHEICDSKGNYIDLDSDGKIIKKSASANLIPTSSADADIQGTMSPVIMLAQGTENVNTRETMPSKTRHSIGINARIAQHARDQAERTQSLALQAERLEQQFKLTGRLTASDKAVNALVTRLKVANQSRIDRASLKSQLTRLFDYIGSADSLNWQELLDVSAPSVSCAANTAPSPRSSATS